MSADLTRKSRATSAQLPYPSYRAGKGSAAARRGILGRARPPEGPGLRAVGDHADELQSREPMTSDLLVTLQRQANEIPTPSDHHTVSRSATRAVMHSPVKKNNRRSRWMKNL
jgi:hypothetical protein